MLLDFYSHIYQNTNAPKLRPQWLQTAGLQSDRFSLDISEITDGELVVEVLSTADSLLASTSVVDASMSFINASMTKLSVTVWRLAVSLPFTLSSVVTLTRVYAEPLSRILIQEFPAIGEQQVLIGAATDWINASQSSITADRTYLLQPTQTQLVYNEGSLLHVRSIPKGERTAAWYQNDTLQSVILERALSGRGHLPKSQLGANMSSVTLFELGLSLWALCLEGQQAQLTAAIRELVYHWAVVLNNIRVDNPLEINDAVTPGLPSILYYNETPHASNRNVYDMAWLGFHLVQCLWYLRGVPKTAQVPTDTTHLFQLSLLLRQLALLVANAVDPVAGWTIAEYDQTGFLGGQADYKTTIMASMFLEALCALDFDQVFHDRAAIAWLAVWRSALLPDRNEFSLTNDSDYAEALIHRLWWGARYRLQHGIATLVDHVLAYSKREDRLSPLMDLALRTFNYELPSEYSAIQLSSLHKLLRPNRIVSFSWHSISGNLAATYWLTENRFNLYALAAYHHSIYQFQLSRWMLPYGYRWFSLEAEFPIGGRLGALLFACIWSDFYWYLRYVNTRQAPYIKAGQGQSLSLRGLALFEPRVLLEPDSWRRQLLSFQLNRTHITRTAFVELTRQKYGLSLLVEEPSQERFPSQLWQRRPRLEPDEPSGRTDQFYIDASISTILASHRHVHKLPDPNLNNGANLPQPVDASVVSLRLYYPNQPSAFSLLWQFNDDTYDVNLWNLQMRFGGGSYNPYHYISRPFLGNADDQREFIEGGYIIPLTADALEITADRTRLPDFRSHPCRAVLIRESVDVDVLHISIAFGAEEYEQGIFSLHFDFTDLEEDKGVFFLRWTFDELDETEALNLNLLYQPTESQGTLQPSNACRYLRLDASVTKIDRRYGVPGYIKPITADQADIRADMQQIASDNSQRFIAWPLQGAQLILRPCEYQAGLAEELQTLVAAGVLAEVRISPTYVL